MKLITNNRPLKKPQVSARQGEIRRKSAVYTQVHEHFEPDFNAESCHMRLFQRSVKRIRENTA